MGFSRIGENHMKHILDRFRRWFLVAVLVLVAGICHSCGRSSETVSLKADAPEEYAESSLVESDPDQESFAEPEDVVCYVHICGAVSEPGVYEMKEGQRIYQAVELAGGYTPEAASDYLNLAETVADGMKVVVPARDELAEDSGESLYGPVLQQEAAEAGRINLNTASREELMRLSGIGEARAEEIIRYRKTHGGFQTIEDIMKVPGIKDAAFQKIKEEITV